MPDDRFPAISVRQPMADLIVWGLKNVENRSKRTRFRGTVLIHASATGPDLEHIADIEKWLRKEKAIAKDEEYSPELGAIIGMVDIVDCVTESASEWFKGPFGWCLANAVEFDDAIPFKGAVGTFYVPRKLLTKTPAAEASAGSSGQ